MSKPAGLHIAPSLSLPVEFVTKTTGILAQRRKGKRLALDTRLPTPTGWTTMGEVAVGDLLFDERGEQCEVTYVGPVAAGDAYRVAFSDGSVIVADAEHLWLTHSRLDRRAGRAAAVRQTSEIAASLTQQGERNHYVPVAGPLALADRALPLHPYALGLWLGDGTRGTGAFTTADPEIVDLLQSDGFEVREQPSQRRGGTASFLIVGIRPVLRALGVLYDKHIPDAYLRAGPSQRRALLMGLMDSDGSIGRRQPQAEFAVTDERLAADAYELLVSLGHKATRSKRPAVLNGVEHGVSYRVQFTPLSQVFRLSRKAERLRQGPPHSHLRSRAVISIEPTPSVPMRCIAVSSPSRLYLAGESLIPTHNTYTASVIAEELVDNGLPFVALDPTGAWWGLRASADGSEAGLPVVIFGGQHGDVPLERGAGKLLAELVVEEPGWYVLDLSLFDIKEAERQFATDFAERLYRRKGQAGGDSPLHLFVDEADLFVPQQSPSGDKRMLGAFESLVRRGGLRGIGTTLISQRHAVVNKNVLEQLDMLIVLRTVGPNDRRAIEDYVKAHGSAEERAALMESLASLEVGEAWVWEPGAEPSLFERVRIRERRTFNSSATPKAGEKRIEPQSMAAVDLDVLKERMAETIERAKADDPRELRRLLALAESLALARSKELDQLRGQLAERAAPERVVVEVPAVPAGLLDLRDEMLEHARGTIDTLGRLTAAVDDAIEQEAAARSTIAASGEATPRSRWKAPTPPASHQPDTGEKTRRAPAAASPRPSSAEPDDGRLGKAERAILTVLASYPAGKNRRQLAALAGLRASGGHFGNVLSKLRTAGRIVGEGAGIYQATDEGLAALGPWEPLPTGPTLLDWWIGQLGRAHADVLRVLVAAWPEEVARAELAEQVGIDASGGHFGNVLSQLRVRDLIVGSSRLRADDDFMAAVNA